jgi:nicotinamidase-related amidase
MTPQDQQYLDFLDDFCTNLKTIQLDSIITDPKSFAIISVDVTNAFCYQGNLASERVAGIINPIMDLFKMAWDQGLEDIVLLQDCHSSQAKEFDEFAVHAVCGDAESEAVDQFKSLPFYEKMKIIEKNSIGLSHNTEFNNWINAHPQITTFIIVGDCTDLCVYQAAMHLQTSANQLDMHRRVIIPADCVNTYHVSLETAKNAGIEPHPADLLHKLFLHHMKLNGIEIIKNMI